MTDKNAYDEGLDNSDEENEEEEPSQEEADCGLLEASRTGNMEQIHFWLSKKGNPSFMKDGWNPLLWAACNGDEAVVRILIKHGGCDQYLTNKSTEKDDSSIGDEDKVVEDEDVDYDPFVKPMDARKHGKYTPLHWASYKGFFKIVWILLKIGMSPLDIDMYGNSAVHQAAASGNLVVLKDFLARGVDVDMKNARGHSPLELTTEPETKKLITRATKTEKCENCKSKFDFKNIRYYCGSSQKFYCKNCSITTWVYEHYDSTEKERPVCRSKAVQKKIKDHEKKLEEAVEAYEYHTIDTALRTCAGIDIDVKLKRRASVLHEKLLHELQIKNFLKENENHENYKLIRKDVQKIEEMVQKAKDQSVELDEELLEQVKAFAAKILSERNLRKQRDLFLESISSCDKDKVDKLQSLIDIAAMSDERGLRIAAKGVKMIIPSANQFNAERLMKSQGRTQTADNDINAINSMGMIPQGYRVNNFLTDADSWYITTDVPNGMKMFSRTPLTTSMEGDFDTGNVRYKARERYAFGCSDFRGIFGCEGA